MSNSANPAQRERALRLTLRSSLTAWCRHALAEKGQAPAPHHLHIIRALDDLAAGRTSRLILLLPPGSAKSTYASTLFPAWWMARNPRGSVIAASHTGGLAAHFGRSVRGLLDQHGARLNVFVRQDARAAGRFLTESGGEYFATGVHGAVTGRRADLVLIDDPVASFDNASSGKRREQLWNWYRSDLVTRLKPGGGIVLAMTRWHEDDLAGRLIDQRIWTVVRLPALAEDGDPLGRIPGAALWPDWEDRESIVAKRETLGERSFSAMFQQSPLPETGELFDLSKLGMVDIVPHGTAVRGWDLAGSVDAARDPDWTVGVLLRRDDANRFTIDDVRRVRVAPAELGKFIREVAAQDGADVTIGLPRDPGQAGMHQVMALTGMLSGFKVNVGAESGSKLSRADAIASQFGVGNVFMRRAPWNRVFTEELAAFPHGRKDDQVDALSRAFAVLAPVVTPARFVSMPFFNR